MTVDIASLSVEQALSMAVRSEEDAAEVYRKLNAAVRNFMLKDKMRFLEEEENRHRQLLTALHRKVADGRDPSPADRSLLPALSLALTESHSVPDLIEIAMDAEKASEEFYDGLSQTVEDRGLREVLLVLASMEHGHYFLLKGEYDLCLRNEAYYDREDFQYDMVHIGP
jgi:rubrerythrin